MFFFVKNVIQNFLYQSYSFLEAKVLNKGIISGQYINTTNVKI